MEVKLGQGIEQTVGKKKKWAAVWENRYFYLLLLPPIITVFVFSYIPMVGILMAFQDFRILKGFFASDWVGLRNFQLFLSDPEFYKVFFYTIKISFTSYIFGFPAPIILALLLNELRNQAFKRVVQSISYLPHFLSWVIAGSIVYSSLTSDGIVNRIITLLGAQPVDFLGNARYFIPMVIFSGIWKEIGWSTIIYLAAISGIQPELYEAAIIDGANKWKRVLHITIPSIRPTIVILGLYSVGGLLSVNFDQVYNLQNDLIRMDTNVIGTYVYYRGIRQGEYSLASAFGLLNSALSLFLLVVANKISKKVSEISLW